MIPIYHDILNEYYILGNFIIFCNKNSNILLNRNFEIQSRTYFFSNQMNPFSDNDKLESKKSGNQNKIK